MKTNKPLLKSVLALAAVASFALVHGKESAHPAATAPSGGKEMPAKKSLVQVAILLDTSNSMDGLIEQAKGQLWKICNEFIKAKQKGVAPEVQVALYEYGKSSLSQKSGWIRQIQPLTTDLDKISEELFALHT